MPAFLNGRSPRTVERVSLSPLRPETFMYFVQIATLHPCEDRCPASSSHLRLLIEIFLYIKLSAANSLYISAYAAPSNLAVFCVFFFVLCLPVLAHDSRVWSFHVQHGDAGPRFVGVCV